MNNRILLLFILFVSISSLTCLGSNKYIDKSLKSKEYFSNLPSTPESFQLFSHGKAGELFIEGKWLTAAQIATWFKKSKRLKGISHLNIYACEFGKGVKGQKAVTDLEKSLNITLAVSDNITGANGDWDLEVGTRKDVLEFPNYPYSLQNEFITTWEVPVGDLDITIPTRWVHTYNYTVDWGDGTPNSTNQTGDAWHTYAIPGVYTVKISGTFPAIYFNYKGDRDKINTIEQWGNIEWLSMYYAFDGCSNLTIKDGIAPPNLSKVENMSYMFCYAVNIDLDASLWDVSNVINMSNIFYDAVSFQGTGLNNWDVGNVTNMSDMFFGAEKFDSDLSTWDVSNVTKMDGLFGYANAFQGTGLNNWDVGNVIDMSGMFCWTDSFQGIEISNWDVSSVTKMSGMFNGSDKFDSNLSTWDVGNVTDMSFMFSWTDLFQGIGLDNWDVSNVTDMYYMFYDIKSFKGEGLNNWDVSQVSNMGNMFSYVSLPSSTYTAILNSWATQTVKNNVNFDGGYSKYCDDLGKNILLSKGWIITDGGKIASVTVDLGADLDNCQGTSVTLDAGNHSGVTYLWNTGETSQIVSVDTLGAFSVEVSSASGCVARDTILVKDDSFPVTPTLADVIGECAAIAEIPSTTDNCSGIITGTTTDPLSYTMQGTYLINWIFDDDNGNSITLPQNVIVDDVTAPVIPNLPDLTGECSFTAVSPTTTDNCSGIITGITTDPLTYNTEGSHVIHWIFDDDNGNSITVPQNVIVDDVTAPIAPVLDDVSGMCTLSLAVPTASDNCAGEIQGTTLDPLTYNTEGSYVVNWTFDDGNGNSSRTAQNVDVFIIVEDVELSSYATELTCDVSNINLTADAKVQGKALYKWFKDGDLIPGETGSVLKIENGDEGEYEVEVSDENLHCNVLSNPILITEDVVVPIVLISPLSGSLSSAESIIINATAVTKGEASYIWSTGEITSSIEVKYPGKYSVEVTDNANGCSVNSSDIGQEAIIMNYWEENLLRAFTPNADGYNDSWRIERVELVQKLKIVIYDRWGKAIYKFSSTGNEYKGTPWKGTDGNVNLPIGSYYYVIKIDDEKPMKGTVTILR
ncbi:MAG: BspA family leucine-rich repeat surface protein [Labilibaculum sp.]|nr:BspA family leucine-rich repeat surface protein [Labilibaculum sp.]